VISAIRLRMFVSRKRVNRLRQLHTCQSNQRFTVNWGTLQLPEDSHDRSLRRGQLDGRLLARQGHLPEVVRERSVSAQGGAQAGGRPEAGPDGLVGDQAAATQAERGRERDEGGRDAGQEDSVRGRGGHDDGLSFADVGRPGGQQYLQDHDVRQLLPEEDPAALGGAADIADFPDPAGYDHPRRLTRQTQGLRHAPSQPIAVRGEAQRVSCRNQCRTRSPRRVHAPCGFRSAGRKSRRRGRASSPRAAAVGRGVRVRWD
jgi:hypothetical protein